MRIHSYSRYTRPRRQRLASSRGRPLPFSQLQVEHRALYLRWRVVSAVGDGHADGPLETVVTDKKTAVLWWLPYRLDVLSICLDG
jgi:hypothetical protein